MPPPKKPNRTQTQTRNTQPPKKPNRTQTRKNVSQRPRPRVTKRVRIDEPVPVITSKSLTSCEEDNVKLKSLIKILTKDLNVEQRRRLFTQKDRLKLNNFNDSYNEN